MGTTVAKLRQIDPFAFEEYVAGMFRNKGYKCYVTSSTGDFGVDVIAEKGDEKIAIQCKRYAKHNLVGVTDIYPIYTGKSFYDCNKAIIVTTSSLNDKAKMLCNNLNIEIWDYRNFDEVDTPINYNIDKFLGIYMTKTQKKALLFWIIVTIISFFIF